MLLKCDAIINLVDQLEDLFYCCIISLDAKNNEACVRVERNHHLHNKDEVNLEMYDERRGVLFYQGIVNRISQVEVNINKLFLVDEKQRRADIRVKTEIPLTLKGISKGKNVKKLNKEVLLETVNVSAGGMLLKCDLDIVDDEICLLYDFPLETKSLNCKAQIVRKRTEDGYYLYGCKLLNEEIDRTELRKFVFSTQIKTKKMAFNLS